MLFIIIINYNDTLFLYFIIYFQKFKIINIFIINYNDTLFLHFYIRFEYLNIKHIKGC